MPVRACAGVMEIGHLETIYRIVNLSLGGVALSGSPGLRRGETYRMVLALAGAAIDVTGSCVWVGSAPIGRRPRPSRARRPPLVGETPEPPGRRPRPSRARRPPLVGETPEPPGTRVSGVQFAELSYEQLEIVTVALRDAIPVHQETAVLVVDPMCCRLDALLTAVRVLGRRAEGVNTPLQAVQGLVTDSFGAVIVAPTLSSTSGEEFLAFVADGFPGVQRVLMFDRNRGRCPADAAASHTLPVPWTLSELDRVSRLAGGT